jgi:Mn2+/Fe2+ NRAMP family transporter
MWVSSSVPTFRGAPCFTQPFLPHIQLTREHMTALIAMLGTTISPYLSFGKLHKKSKR